VPESPEELYARVVAEVGEHGRLPASPATEWDSFPWEVVDGALVPKVLRPPSGAEPPRKGDPGGGPCPVCTDAGETRIWENDRWSVRPFHRSGMPLVLFLEPREHLDFTDLDDDLAAEYGRLTVRLGRIIGNLPHVGRVHVFRIGDGVSHLHVWFVARPERLPGIVGSMAIEWDDILPPPPEDVWRADLRTVAHQLATHDGRALIG
jgi:diadenosine tetraphosphate (Ap4A) HIT family hydrolase